MLLSGVYLYYNLHKNINTLLKKFVSVIHV